MEPNVLMSDFELTINGGVGPGSVAIGTTSGSKIACSALGLGPLRKLTFKLFCTQGTAAGVVTLQVFTASVASGTYASIAGLSTSIDVAAANSLYVDQIEIRTGLLADLGLGGGAGVMPVVTITGAATNAFLEVTGWNSGIQPTRRLLSNAAFNNVVVSEVDMLGITTGGPAITSPQ